MLLIDGSMLFWRCRSKMDFLKTSTNVPTGLEFGTLRTLQSLSKKYPEQKIVICLDSTDGWKRAINSAYKANRSRLSRDEYDRQQEFTKFLHCYYWMANKSGFEADDVMYTLSQLQRGSHLLYTNDDDLLQAIDDSRSVKVLKSFGSKLFEWDEDKVRNKYGVRPTLLALFRSFVGDKSDNLDGVPRIKKEYLAELLEWAWAQHLTLSQMVQEIVTADWSDKTSAAVRKFVDSGKWKMNYDLIKLRTVGCNVTAPEFNRDFALRCLKQWEIRTLDICQAFADELVEESEF